MNTNTAQVVLLIVIMLLPVGMMGLLMYVDGFRWVRLLGVVCSLAVGITALSVI